jgi:FkbM family methyltransferase
LLARSVAAIPGEVLVAWRLAHGPRSFARLAVDVFLYRLLRLGTRFGGRRRRVQLRDGAVLHYRLDRGDIRTIREVWSDEVYLLPPPAGPRTLVDLGANIGLASVWLARRYGCDHVLAVEPWPANAQVARLNLEANGLPAELVEAAVGPATGPGHLDHAAAAAERDSALARLGDSGLPVQVLSIRDILERLPGGRTPDLVKIDVEGAEDHLLTGDLTWLADVKVVVAELHCHMVDCEALIANLRSAGLPPVRIDREASGNLLLGVFARPAGH